MFQLAFTTTDYNIGRSILIEDASTDWSSAPGGVQSATFVITSLYAGTVLSPSAATVTIPIATTSFEAGFQYNITSVDLGLNLSDTIPDSIYTIVMTLNDSGGVITGVGNTYTSDEVVYYNASYERDNFIASQASYIDYVYNKDMDYANWLDFLVTSIEANANSGNSSAVYYIFDIFKRLDTV